MIKPVRWYSLLSTWIFILSALYPIIKFPTFPLNILALSGIYETINRPFKEHYLKNIYILLLHILPFLWIPYDLSIQAFIFGAVVIVTYLITMNLINDDPIDIYTRLLNEEHTTFSEFIKDRFGIRF